VPELTPSLFERVPRGLFGPLGDPNAELYWEVLAELYRHEFERNPFVVTRATAIDVAETSIRHSRLWRERRQDFEALANQNTAPSDPTSILAHEVASTAREPSPFTVDPEVVDEAAAIRALARRLVARLEESGWMHFQYRSGIGEIMSFHAYAARILQALLEVARDEQPVFQGLVHSIAALLEPTAFAQRPGVSLSEARRHTLELSRELKILERNIHLFIQRVLDDAATAAQVLEEGFDRYEHAVMANYHRLKTVDNVYRQRSAILQRLDAIERDTAALENAAEWYAAQRGTGVGDGRVAVKTELALMRSHFDNIPQLVDDIDTRNARFSGVALRKVRYFLRQDRRIEGQLQFIVDALAQDEAPELEFDVFKCELLAGHFLYTAPVSRERPAPQRVVAQPTGNRERIRQDAAARLRRMFARRRIEEFVASVLRGRTAAPMRDVPVGADHEYVRLLYLASYGLDGDSTYRFRPTNGRLEATMYGYPDGTLEAQRKNRGHGR
jgi:Wadjet protein JetA